jgi:hypothetical protein
MAYASWSVVFGEQPSAAKWNILGTNDASFNDGTGIANIDIGSGHTSIKNDHKFFVYRAAAHTSNSSFTLIQFDTKVFDTGTNIDVTTNKGRFTAPIAGFYMFMGVAGNTAATSTQMGLQLYKNGSVQLDGTIIDPSLNVGTYLSLAGMLQLNANDYVELYFVGGAGSTMGVGQQNCFFQGFLISQT